MKRKSLVLPLLFLAAITSCSTTNTSSSSPISDNSTSQETTSSSSLTDSSSSLPDSSSSETTDASLSSALKAIKTGYDAIVSFTGSYGGSSDYTWDSFTLQEVLKSHEYYARRDVSLNRDGSLSLESSMAPFTIVEADEDGYNYSKALSASNEAIDVYDDPSYANTRFEMRYYNPFSFLGLDDFTLTDNQYHIPEAQAMAIASRFDVSISTYEDRAFDAAYFTIEDNEFVSFSYSYKVKESSGNNLRFSLTIRFQETGEDIQHPTINPISDDSSDKSALKTAFEKVSGDNFTLTFTLTPGSMNMVSGRKYRFYFDGTNIFVYTNLYYSTPSLVTGDYLFTPNGNGQMTLSLYNSSTKSFEPYNEYMEGYQNQKPALRSISMNLFNNTNGTYTPNSSIGSNTTLICRALFNSFIPQILHSNTMKYNANSLSIEIDTNGYPSITETFFYDMSGDGSGNFGENETVTITYSNVGTTTLPEEVRALINN